MEIKLLTQGLSEDLSDTVGQALLDLFESEEYSSFFGLTAFVSVSAVRGLSERIEQVKERFTKIVLIVGVDQKVTSKEALEAILALGIDAYVFYQPSNPIFHPKLYLFEGETKTCLIVGSSNFTQQGLFSNVEASVRLDFSSDEQEIINPIKSSLGSLFDLTDPNLQALTQEVIDALVDAEIVPTETERKALYAPVDFKNVVEDDGGENYGDDNNELDAGEVIKTLFPPRKNIKIPVGFRIKQAAQPTAPVIANTNGPINTNALPAQVVPPVQAPVVIPAPQLAAQGNVNFSLVWKRQSLPASSVEIAGGANTNPTGGLRLVQGNFLHGGHVIDQTTYFRNNVFGQLQWQVISMSPNVEAATATFEVYVLGNYWGSHDLTIRHKPTGEAGQGNYTTSISWGGISAQIRQAVLTGKTLSLYQDINNPDVYKIEIA